jgi:hypothetical protein
MSELHSCPSNQRPGHETAPRPVFFTSATFDQVKSRPKVRFWRIVLSAVEAKGVR